MTKYVVMFYKEKTGTDCEEGTLIGIYDTEEQANEKALERDALIPDAEKSTSYVEVGLITEDDLEEKGNWNSFTRLESIWYVGEED